MRQSSHTAERIGAFSVVLAALAAVLAQAWLVAATVAHPWPLEWMEGGVVETALRLRDGGSIYPAPTVEFVGYVYTPGYFAVVAAVSSIAGGDVVTARVVSLLATAGVLSIVGAYVRRDTGTWWLAAGGIGILAASHGLAGFFLHLARVDALALLLLLAAIVVLAHGRGARSAISAGVVAAAAVLTKQSHVIAIVATITGLAFVDARRAGIAAGVSGGLLLGSFAALGAATSGWFLYYTVDLPAQHGSFLGAAAIHGAERMLVLGPALALCVGSLVVRLRGGEPRAKLDASIFAGLVATSWLGLAHPGGFWNTLLPAAAAAALFTPSAIGSFLRDRPFLSISIVAPLLAAQIVAVIVLYPPGDAAPREGDRAQAERFIVWMADQPGEVLVPDLRYFQTRAGKRSHGLGQAARDVLFASPEDRGRRMLEESLATALAEQRFSAIVTSEPDWLGGAVELTYEPRGPIAGLPVPPIGAPRRPRWLFVPR